MIELDRALALAARMEHEGAHPLDIRARVGDEVADALGLASSPCGVHCYPGPVDACERCARARTETMAAIDAQQAAEAVTAAGLRAKGVRAAMRRRAAA